MVGLTHALALEVAARGVTVNAVAPGWIATEAATPEELRAARATAVKDYLVVHGKIDPAKISATGIVELCNRRALELLETSLDNVPADVLQLHHGVPAAFTGIQLANHLGDSLRIGGTVRHYQGIGRGGRPDVAIDRNQRSHEAGNFAGTRRIEFNDPGDELRRRGVFCG